MVGGVVSLGLREETDEIERRPSRQAGPQPPRTVRICEERAHKAQLAACHNVNHLVGESITILLEKPRRVVDDDACVVDDAKAAATVQTLEGRVATDVRVELAYERLVRGWV